MDLLIHQTFPGKPLCAVPSRTMEAQVEMSAVQPSSEARGERALEILAAYQPWESETWFPMQMGFSLPFPQNLKLRLSALVSSDANGNVPPGPSLTGSSKAHDWLSHVGEDDRSWALSSGHIRWMVVWQTSHVKIAFTHQLPPSEWNSHWLPLCVVGIGIICWQKRKRTKINMKKFVSAEREF